MSSSTTSSSSATPNLSSESGIVDTIQSLIVAFVLAMTFRGFVAEGFVIPTGSMAPTLMGQHTLFHSDLTGYTFPVGRDRQMAESTQAMRRPVDPMLGPRYPLHTGLRLTQALPRAGDRILVLKTLYPFFQPKRFDVVVFKNPTDPKGDSANYIKRLIGLPGEEVLLVDGDVFTKRRGEDAFRVQRKPEHVQRTLWQPVYDSDHALVHPGRLDMHYSGPPWQGKAWDTRGRVFRCDDASPTKLIWDNSERELDDWTAYNMLATHSMSVPVSDLRIVAGIVPDDEGLETTLEIEARGHLFSFAINGREAIVRYRSADDASAWIAEERVAVAQLRPQRVTNVEFWHVDQSMSIFINGRRVVLLEYEWTASQRDEFAAVGYGDQLSRNRHTADPDQTQLVWRFEGSPVTLHRVRTDRDVYYRAAMLESRQQQNEPKIDGPAFGTHPTNPAALGPDHFFMLGDNSQHSLDSRLWGSPHALVAEQIDPSPFVVHRKLLVGKAWVVYYPAMHAITEEGVNIIPDFGRLRYIR